MSFVNILEFNDDGTPMRVEVGHGLVRITEDANTNISATIVVTTKGLADIGEAVALEIEPEPFFTEEDLEAGRQAIAEYIEELE